MLKKTLIGAAVAAVVSSFIFGRDVMSYARTFGSEVRNAVKSEIDVEFEVERARRLVEDLVPEIRKCMHVIAEQKVEVDELAQDVTERELALSRQEDAILALRDHLGSDRKTFVFASRNYSRAEVERDLKLRFERFRAAESSLKSDMQILAAREKSLRANEDTLQGMLGQKQTLEVELAQLEARLTYRYAGRDFRLTDIYGEVVSPIIA